MNYAEARSEAIQGARITSDTIQEGAYVDYQFNGLRIVFPSGSHSGFRSTDADEAAEWRMWQAEPAPAPWGTFARGLPPAPPAAPNVGKWGLPRIDLGEQGVPMTAHNPPRYEGPKSVVLDMDNALRRFAREPKQDNLVKLTPFELAQQKAKEGKSKPPVAEEPRDLEDEYRRWTNLILGDKKPTPVKRDSWGRPIDDNA